MNIKKTVICRRNAQGMLEYVMLVGIVVIALVSMTLAIKRGAQSIIKTAADELSVQQNSDQSFSNLTGYLNYQTANYQDDRQKRILESVGIINYVQDDSTFGISASLTNMGFAGE